MHTNRDEIVKETAVMQEVPTSHFVLIDRPLYLIYYNCLSVFPIISPSLLLYSTYFSFFFFNDTATTEIYTLSLHDALPISRLLGLLALDRRDDLVDGPGAEA